MGTPVAPFVIVNIVARNLVPVSGILFFGWSAHNTLLLYFVDTMFALGVIIAGLMTYFLPPDTAEGLAARINAESGYVAAAAFLVVFMAVPLGMPIVFIFAAAHASWTEILADRAFQTGLAMQAGTAIWSYLDLYRALRTYTPEELRLKRRFAIVLLRWAAMIAVTYTGLIFLFGEYGSLVFVALYAGLMIFTELAPDRFLRLMNDHDDAEPGTAARPSVTSTPPIAGKSSVGAPARDRRWRKRKRR